jgi:hypothetical protein
VTGTPNAAARRQLVREFTADDLRQLAAIMDATSPRQAARRRLSPEALDALAVMLAASKTPSIGWWRRNG